MFKQISILVMPIAFLASALTSAQTVELTEEQRAEIAARIAPVGAVCLQGENCGGLPRPSAPAQTAAATGTTGTAADAAMSDGATQVAAASVDGEAVYNQACLACHMTGAGGAPKVGDVDAWAPRIAKGIESLHNSGLQGVSGTAMMAKGGRADLSDDEIIAAVDYMIAGSQ